MSNISSALATLRLSHTFEGQTEEVIFGDLPEASQLYLVRYGFGQTLGDATAATKGVAVDDRKARHAKKARSLREGTIGTRETDPLAVAMARVADEKIRSHLVAKGLQVGSAAELREKVTRAMAVEAFRADVEAEAKRRLAATKALDDAAAAALDELF